MKEQHDAIVRLAVSTPALVWSAHIELPGLRKTFDLMGRMGEAPRSCLSNSERLIRGASTAALKTVSGILKTPYKEKASIHFETSWEMFAVSVQAGDDRILSNWVYKRFNVSVSLIPHHIVTADLEMAKFLVGYWPKKPAAGTQIAMTEVTNAEAA